MLIKKVILDTSFLISLANASDSRHSNAKVFFEYFFSQKIPVYLSSIVSSEFEAKQTLDDDLIKSLRILNFNMSDGRLAGKFVGQKFARDGANRDRVKDDYKILAQAINNKIDCIITADEEAIKKIFEPIKNDFQLDINFISLNEDAEKLFNIQPKML